MLIAFFRQLKTEAETKFIRPGSQLLAKPCAVRYFKSGKIMGVHVSWLTWARLCRSLSLLTFAIGNQLTLQCKISENKRQKQRKCTVVLMSWVMTAGVENNILCLDTGDWPKQDLILSAVVSCRLIVINTAVQILCLLLLEISWLCSVKYLPNSKAKELHSCGH